MITITRSMARLVRAVFRKALGTAARGRFGVVLLEAGPKGLTWKFRYNNVAVEYRVPGQYATQRLAVSIDLLKEVEGCKDEPVQIEQTGKREVEAQWTHNALPQTKLFSAYVPQEVLKGFPTAPDEMLANPPRLLTALRDASETANPHPLRFATNMIQLRGDGSLGATDGSHLIVHRGFTLPCQGELLFPSNKIFGAKELPKEETVYIGRSEDWISLAVGDWLFHIGIDKEGRFPRLDDHIRSPAAATTRLQLSEPDAAFLSQALDRLPCHDEMHFPVTLDLNGQVAIRAKSEDLARVTELVLTSSTSTGAPLVLNTNRRYLARAVQLGFREMLAFSNHTPMQCQDEGRSYLWAVLDPESAIKPSKDSIRIESPSPDGATKQEPKQKRKQTMPRRKASDFGVVPPAAPSNGTESNGTENGQANGPANGAPNDASNGAANGEPAGEVSLIEQAEAVRTSLKESADKVGELIAALKRHRKQSRLVQSTLSSLRQLQSLDA